MKHKRIWIVFLVIMLFAVLMLTGCTEKDSKVSKAVKIYETVSEQTIQIEKDYLNEDGYIKSDDVENVLSEVYACAQTLYEDGIITDYAYKTGDTCVYMKIDDWLGFVYMPPLEDALSGGSDGKVEIYTVQPYSTEFTAYRLAFGSGVFFNKTPDITADLLQKTFGEECEYKKNYDDNEISIEILLNFPKRSVVMWEGHGGYNDRIGSFLGLGNQKLDEQTLDVYDIFVGQDALLVAQNGQYCVTSVFFEKVVPENAYEGCLFYLNTCSSFADKRLALSIWDKGARCVVGNTTETWIPYSTTMMYRFFEGFTKQNDSGNFYTVSEALNYAKEKEGEIDPLYGSRVEAAYRDDFAFPDMLSEMPDETEETKAASVQFEHFQESGDEYAVITGLDETGKELWTYATERYSQTELNRIEEIGIFNDKYYYNESGTIVALDMAAGTVLWKNSDFGGASVHSVIDENGNIYICGYYGPDFYAVDSEGNSLCKIETFDEAYYWACGIRKQENTVEVTMEGGPEGYSDGKTFYVNLEDYSYSDASETKSAAALSTEQLKNVCKQLGVPKELNVEISQESPVYREVGECWTIYVTVYYDGAMVAAANVNSETAELVKDIWQYTPNENTSGTAVGISETWIQEDVNDPLMFEFQKDGTVFYMPTVSREAEYTTKYTIENNILTIQLVEIGATGVVPVSYKLTYDNSNGNSRVRLELIEPEKDVDVSRLYGWESIIPGWYGREGKGTLSTSEE